MYAMWMSPNQLSRCNSRLRKIECYWLKHKRDTIIDIFYLFDAEMQMLLAWKPPLNRWISLISRPWHGLRAMWFTRLTMWHLPWEVCQTSTRNRSVFIPCCLTKKNRWKYSKHLVRPEKMQYDRLHRRRGTISVNCPARPTMQTMMLQIESHNTWHPSTG